MTALELTPVWDKTFPQSDKVEHGKITFHNRYGIELAADVYKPKRVRRTQIQGDRRLGTLRRSEGAGKRPVCADLGRARVPHDRVRPVVHRRIRRLAPRGRLPRHQHRGFLRRRGLSGEPHRRGSGGHRHCGYLRLRRPGTQRGRERPAHQGHRGEHHVRHEPRHRERLLRRRRLGRQTQ